MKQLFALIIFSMNIAFANNTAVKATVKEDQAAVSTEGIDFNEWESEFDSSMDKAKLKVRKCETKSKNCQFEKFQALDPAFDMVQ